MTTIDQLTQDLATAQAEIARLHNLLWLAKDKLEVFRKHSDGQYQGGIEYTQLWNMIDEALSQPSPSLQAYRDKVIEECADVAFQFGKKYSNRIGNKDELMIKTAYMAAASSIYDAIRGLKHDGTNTREVL